MCKVYLFVAMCIILTEVVLGAPKAATDAQLEKQMAKFLAQDKEFQNALERATLMDNSEVLTRNKRQTENMDLDGVDMEGQQGQEGGFFDRAAKFVMELLQRFLKWVNTDSGN